MDNEFCAVKLLHPLVQKQLCV